MRPHSRALEKCKPCGGWKLQLQRFDFVIILDGIHDSGVLPVRRFTTSFSTKQTRFLVRNSSIRPWAIARTSNRSLFRKAQDSTSTIPPTDELLESVLTAFRNSSLDYWDRRRPDKPIDCDPPCRANFHLAEFAGHLLQARDGLRGHSAANQRSYDQTPIHKDSRGYRTGRSVWDAFVR